LQKARIFCTGGTQQFECPLCLTTREVQKNADLTYAATPNCREQAITRFDRWSLSDMAKLQQLGTRAVGGCGGLLQHLPENIASLVHGFAGGIVLGGVDVNRLAADGAIVFGL
jgi:hypothetical protein